MTKFAISTDSCCDELAFNLEKLNVYSVPLNYSENDNLYEDSFKCNEDYQFFYNQLLNGRIYKTNGINDYAIENLFKLIQKENKQQDILHISLSSGLSSCFSVAERVANEFNEKGKNKIFVLDSKSATLGQRQVLDQAIICRDKGMTLEETVDYLQKKVIEKSDVAFFVDDLDFLKRGGRISSLHATIGKMLQIKPLLEFHIDDGKLYVIDKIKGQKRAIQALLERVKKNYNRENNTAIYIAHTGNLNSAFELKERLEAEFNSPKIILGFIGPVIGSHTGPGALGIIYIKK